MRSFLLRLLDPSSGISSARFIAIASLAFSFVVVLIYIITLVFISTTKFSSDELKPILDFITFVLGISIAGSTTSKFATPTATTSDNATETTTTMNGDK